MMSDLTEWFREQAWSGYGGLRCEEILAQHPDKAFCGQIIAETYRKVLDILTVYGVATTKPNLPPT
jgi:hypothetical protein